MASFLFHWKRKWQVCDIAAVVYADNMLQVKNVLYSNIVGNKKSPIIFKTSNVLAIDQLS